MNLILGFRLFHHKSELREQMEADIKETLPLAGWLDEGEPHHHQPSQSLLCSSVGCPPGGMFLFHWQGGNTL